MPQSIYFSGREHETKWPSTAAPVRLALTPAATRILYYAGTSYPPETLLIRMSEPANMASTILRASALLLA